VIVLFTSVFLFSCTDRKNVWQQSETITDCIWNKDTALKFNIPVEDTAGWYSLSIGLRNRTDYSFQNLYLFLKITAPSGASTLDTLNVTLANDDGSWIGSGGLFSKYKENTFLYRQYVLFPKKGDYSVTVRHGMRKDDLEGIASVDLILHNSIN
jgi:gliding motility-associated lipoprotein GldH